MSWYNVSVDFRVQADSVGEASRKVQALVQALPIPAGMDDFSVEATALASAGSGGSWASESERHEHHA